MSIDRNSTGRARWLVPLALLVVAMFATIAFLLGGRFERSNSRFDRQQASNQQQNQIIRAVRRASRRADREIQSSRINQVWATCHQFNNNQLALSRVIRATLGPRLDPHLRVAFKHELRALRPNDCAAQRRLLESRLRASKFRIFVPYQHRYRVQH